MLATAVHLGEPTDGYWRPDHPVQVRIRRVLEDLTGAPRRRRVRHRRLLGAELGDPARGLAARLRALVHRGEGSTRAACAPTARRICEACSVAPRSRRRPRPPRHARSCSACRARCSSRAGAEGVYCGALPEHGLGFALKIDDGAKRAAEAVARALIARFYPEAQRRRPRRRAHQLARPRGRARCAPRPSWTPCSPACHSDPNGSCTHPRCQNSGIATEPTRVASDRRRKIRP